jgi:hypothetical protein
MITYNNLSKITWNNQGLIYGSLKIIKNNIGYNNLK